MSVRGIIGGTVRGLVIAAATAAAAFGALIVFEPFGNAAAPAPAASSTSPASLALQQRIEALRLSLRETEQAIDVAPTSGDAASRAQYDAQIAAATERRDLALRHADAIRKSLEAGVTPSSLAAIRDSVVIGQMLTQQVALDGQIAVDSARLRPNHPTMRALNAQRDALTTQIRQEAASIASALESEAKIDATQIELLQAQLPTLAPAATTDIASLEAQATAQRIELDSLVDAYFSIPASTAAPVAAPRDILSVRNMAIVAVAAVAALLFQLFLAARRRKARIAAEVTAWRADLDPQTAEQVPPEAETSRRAA